MGAWMRARAHSLRCSPPPIEASRIGPRQIAQLKSVISCVFSALVLRPILAGIMKQCIGFMTWVLVALVVSRRQREDVTLSDAWLPDLSR